MKIFIFVVSAALFTGCAEDLFLAKDFNADTKRTVNVGAVMCTWGLGYLSGRNDTFYRRTSNELIYNGISDSTIFVAYREFQAETSEQFDPMLARPAFSNELKYSLRGNRAIAYQNLLLEVIDATPTNITFRVKHDPWPEALNLDSLKASEKHSDPDNWNLPPYRRVH